jgi:hypothetical protein
LREEKENPTKYAVLISILLFIALLIIFAVLFSTMGVSFTNPIFEMGSRYQQTVFLGKNVAMPLGYK